MSHMMIYQIRFQRVDTIKQFRQDKHAWLGFMVDKKLEIYDKIKEPTHINGISSSKNKADKKSPKQWP